MKIWTIAVSRTLDTGIFYLIIKWVFFSSYLSIYEMSKLILKHWKKKISARIHLSYVDFSKSFSNSKKTFDNMIISIVPQFYN